MEVDHAHLTLRTREMIETVTTAVVVIAQREVTSMTEDKDVVVIIKKGNGKGKKNKNA